MSSETSTSSRNKTSTSKSAATSLSYLDEDVIERVYSALRSFGNTKTRCASNTVTASQLPLALANFCKDPPPPAADELSRILNTLESQERIKVNPRTRSIRLLEDIPSPLKRTSSSGVSSKIPPQKRPSTSLVSPAKRTKLSSAKEPEDDGDDTIDLTQQLEDEVTLIRRNSQSGEKSSSTLVQQVCATIPKMTTTTTTTTSSSTTSRTTPFFSFSSSSSSLTSSSLTSSSSSSPSSSLLSFPTSSSSQNPPISTSSSLPPLPALIPAPVPTPESARCPICDIVLPNDERQQNAHVDECLNLQTLKEEGIAIIGSSRPPLIPHHAIPHPHYRPVMRFDEEDDEDEEDSDEEEEDSDEEEDDDEESDINPWLMVCPFARCGRTMDARSFQSHINSNHMRERHKKHFCPVCALLVATVKKRVVVPVDLFDHLAIHHPELNSGSSSSSSSYSSTSASATSTSSTSNGNNHSVPEPIPVVPPLIPNYQQRDNPGVGRGITGMGLGGMGVRGVGLGGGISSYVWPGFAATSSSSPSSSSYPFGRDVIGGVGVGAAAWKPAIEVWKSLEEQNFEMQEYSEEECTICLCEFDKGAPVTKLSCRCLFHRKCIESWFGRSGKRECPTHMKS